MGIAGHMLGPKALARLNRRTGVEFDRAYIRGHECEGRRLVMGRCLHYTVDLATNRATIKPEALLPEGHWSSCYRDGRVDRPSTGLYGGPVDT